MKLLILGALTTLPLWGTCGSIFKTKEPTGGAVVEMTVRPFKISYTVGGDVLIQGGDLLELTRMDTTGTRLMWTRFVPTAFHPGRTNWVGVGVWEENTFYFALSSGGYTFLVQEVPVDAEAEAVASSLESTGVVRATLGDDEDFLKFAPREIGVPFVVDLSLRKENDTLIVTVNPNAESPAKFSYHLREKTWSAFP